MTQENIRPNIKFSGSTLSFPTWKSLIQELFSSYINDKDSINISPREINEKLQLIDSVRKSIDEFHPSQIIEMLAEGSNISIPQIEFDDLLEQFKKICIADNQFFTVYDISLGKHILIDPKIELALGIKPHEFSLQAMAGLDAGNNLYHIDDVFHMIRWASLSYLLIRFQAFKWNTLKDYYYVSHRVGTQLSRIKSIKQRGSVILEKRCYPLFCQDATGKHKPAFHFDQWSVLDPEGFDSVKPKWVTTSEPAEVVNALFYLLNAYMIDFNVKHTIILNEKKCADRNKSIAKNLEVKLSKHLNADITVEESKVADTFSKTIRSSIAQTFNKWDKRSKTNLVTVYSDQEAHELAKRLGIVPIPNLVEELILKNVCSI